MGSFFSKNNSTSTCTSDGKTKVGIGHCSRDDWILVGVVTFLIIAIIVAVIFFMRRGKTKKPDPMYGKVTPNKLAN